MRGTNLHTRIFTWLVKVQFDGFRKRTFADMKIPAPVRGIRTKSIPALFGHEVGIEDFEDSGMHFPQPQLIWLLNRLTFISDPSDRYESTEQAERELRAIFGDRLREITDWRDPTSDAALRLLATQGIAAHLLEETEDGDGYQVDLSGLEDLEVRDGFARYGAKLLFDASMRPIAIERLGERHEPGDDSWEVAKLCFRSAVALSATVRDHAVHCHFLASNAFVVATRRRLSPSHPLRLLLHPFQYRTPTINAGALRTLVPERAIFHRLWGLEWEEGLQKLYRSAIDQYRLETLDEDVRRRGVAGVPGYAYGEDGADFQKSIESLVARWLDALDVEKVPVDDPEIRAWRDDVAALLPEGALVGELATHEELVRLASYFIFNSSAFHEQVGGSIGDYLDRPDFVVPGLREGSDVVSMLPTRNTMVQSYMLGVLTNFRVPSITTDFSDPMPARGRPIVDRWLEDLKRMKATVKERNAARDQAFHTLDPEHLEISVSI